MDLVHDDYAIPIRMKSFNQLVLGEAGCRRWQRCSGAGEQRTVVSTTRGGGTSSDEVQASDVDQDLLSAEEQSGNRT